MGGKLSNEGRVEVCHDNHYGTVCEDNWNATAASVVCGALGFETEGEQFVGYDEAKSCLPAIRCYSFERWLL